MPPNEYVTWGLVLAVVALSAAVWRLWREKKKDIRRHYFNAAAIALSTAIEGTPVHPLKPRPKMTYNAVALQDWLGQRRLPPATIASLWAAVQAGTALPPADAPETDQRSLQAAIESPAWTPAPQPAHYHAALLALFKALQPVWCGHLRLFYERNIFEEAAHPDFVFTPAKEAAATGTNAVIMAEVKRPSRFATPDGIRQLRTYVCTRLKQQVTSMARAAKTIKDLCNVQGVGFVTSVEEIVIMRARLEFSWDADNELNCTIKVELSDTMQLLDATHGPVTPGFEALCALLSTPVSILGHERHAPSSLALRSGLQVVRMPVLHHLGSGGFSDAYSVALGGGETAVVKQPHHMDVTRRANIGEERAALARLPRIPELPFLVPAFSGDTSDLLVFQPVGTDLLTALDESVARAAPNEHAALEARRAFARAVYYALLTALRAAHDAGVTHGDVRPPNVVAWGSTFVLVDWGQAVVHKPQRSAPQSAAFDAARAKDLQGACFTYLRLTGPVSRPDPTKEYKPLVVVPGCVDPMDETALRSYVGCTDALVGYYINTLRAHPLAQGAYQPPL